MRSCSREQGKWTACFFSGCLPGQSTALGLRVFCLAGPANTCQSLGAESGIGSFCSAGGIVCADFGSISRWSSAETAVR